MCGGCIQSGLNVAESVGLEPSTTKALSIATAAVMLFSLSAPLVPTSSSVRAGAVCAKANQKVVKSDKTFVCKKSGKKFVWKVQKKKLITPPDETVVPVVPPKKVEYQNPSQPSDNIQSCQIREVKPRNARAGPDGAPILLPSGFPRVTPATQHLGTVTWALIPIDFPDLSGDLNFESRVDGQMKSVTDWFDTVSEGKLKVNWRVASKWVRLPKPTTEYVIPFSVNLRDSENGIKLWRDAMAAADPGFDFTNIQQVIFVLPKGQTFMKETSQGFPWDKAVIDLKTNEGSVAGFAVTGSDFDWPGRQYWPHWAHEFGHSISLAHIGSSRGDNPPFNPFDLMGGQEGPSRELNGWMRFLAGWLVDEKIYCKAATNLTDLKLTLAPLSDQKSGLKLAIIPVSQTKAVLVESRRFTKFSCGPKDRNGVLVYTYDARLSHGEDFLVPIRPTGRPVVNINTPESPCWTQPFADPLLYEGDSVTVEGMTIKVLQSGDYDQIQVQRP